MDLLPIISVLGSGAIAGFLAGTWAAHKVHRALDVDVNDALERVAYLYDRIRKRTKLDGSSSDHPAVAELRPTKESIMALAAQRGLLASQRR